MTTENTTAFQVKFTLFNGRRRAHIRKGPDDFWLTINVSAADRMLRKGTATEVEK